MPTNEIATEIIQGKGESETHPSIAINDEFAAFEAVTVQLSVMKPLTGAALGARTSYAREAYKNGLAIEDKIGVNPFKFGLVAGSDSHVGAACEVCGLAGRQAATRHHSRNGDLRQG